MQKSHITCASCQPGSVKCLPCAHPFCWLPVEGEKVSQTRGCWNSLMWAVCDHFPSLPDIESTFKLKCTRRRDWGYPLSLVERKEICHFGSLNAVVQYLCHKKLTIPQLSCTVFAKCSVVFLLVTNGWIAPVMRESELPNMSAFQEVRLESIPWKWAGQRGLACLLQLERDLTTTKNAQAKRRMDW